jgi:hypothetical protein
MHRLPENHSCNADFISLGKKKLKLENPKVEACKIPPV